MAYVAGSEALTQDVYSTTLPTLADNEFLTWDIERTDSGTTSIWTVKVETSTDKTRLAGPQAGPWSEVPARFGNIANADKQIAGFIAYVADVRVIVGRANGSDTVTATIHWLVGKLYPDPV